MKKNVEETPNYSAVVRLPCFPCRFKVDATPFSKSPFHSDFFLMTRACFWVTVLPRYQNLQCGNEELTHSPFSPFHGHATLALKSSPTGKRSWVFHCALFLHFYLKWPPWSSREEGVARTYILKNITGVTRATNCKTKAIASTSLFCWLLSLVHILLQHRCTRTAIPCMKTTKCNTGTSSVRCCGAVLIFSSHSRSQIWINLHLDYLWHCSPSESIPDHFPGSICGWLKLCTDRAH